MAYIERRVYAGKTVEIKRYHTRQQKSKGQPRIRKEPTTEERQKSNLKQAEEKLRQKLNENFSENDLLVTLSYSKENGNKTRTAEQMKEDKKLFFRELRKKYKAEGGEMKFVYVAEIGPLGSRHHHVVLSGIDPKIIKDCWPYGFADFKYLDKSGNYKKIASYFIKYSEKTFRTVGKLAGQRYSCSRNLREPKVRKTVITKADTFAKNVRAPKGFYLDKESERFGVDMYGNVFHQYILVRLE